MKKIAVLAGVLMLGGCVSSTQYTPESKRGGYSDVQISPDVYEVRAVVNHKTEPQIARDYALIRTAELACKNGYSSFELLDESFTNSTGKRAYQHLGISMLRVKMHKPSDDKYYDPKTILLQMNSRYDLSIDCQD